MGIAFLIIGLLSTAGGMALSIYFTRAYVKDEKTLIPDKKHLLYVGGGLLLSGIGAIFLTICPNVWKQWNMTAGHLAMGIIGNFFFAVCFLLLWYAFYVRFYKKGLEIDAKLFKWVRIVMFSCIPLSLGFFLLAGEGMAPYLFYPLANGIVINGHGFGLYNYLNEGSSEHAGGLHIAFYGVVILAGAIIAYKISDHHMYQKYGRHGIIDGCFLWAFPSGIIGARIWYVVGNWNGDGAGGPNYSQYCADGQWFKMFAIWEGGLTILGGAVFGIAAGVIYMLIRRKYVDIRVAVDLIVPTILIAQAIGRWGNFFNHEVYGQKVAMESLGFLPTWLRNQMATAFYGGVPTAEAYIPLFLIEGAINIAGYFIIWYGVRLLWKKGRALGDLAGCYLIWYGIVRMILEPLRDRSYNMGQNGLWSFWNSMVYVLLGLAVIAGCQLYAWYRKKHGLPEEINRAPMPKVKQASAKSGTIDPSALKSAPKQRKKEEEE